jgi:4-hydroxybenzoyl-CoA thioesterase
MIASRTRIRVEWEHCDPAGIVFYPRYFAWFDGCTTRLFESVGFPPGAFFADIGVVGYPLLEAHAKFRVASRFGDDIDTESAIVGWQSKAFRISHRFTRGSTLLIEGWETRIFVVADPEDPAHLRSIPIPDRVRRRFDGEAGP